MSRGRITSIVIVALLHALLGYAFVTGLAFNVVKQVAQDLKTFDVIEEPPPPEEEPPPPVETPQQVMPPPVVAPPPIVRINTPAPVIQTVRTAPPPVITPRAVPAPPAPVVAPPAPPVKAQDARAKANLGSYVSNDDYPPAALRSEEEGTTGFRLSIGTNGRVTDCVVTSPSGSSSLDATTCRLMRSRARFTPAKDSAGNPTTDTHTNRITWRIEQ